MSLTATPPTLAFSVLERGHVHYAMTLQLHSFDAADAVELRMHCTNPRLTIEALPDQPGAVRVALLCSVAGVVQGSIVCTASSKAAFSLSRKDAESERTSFRVTTKSSSGVSQGVSVAVSLSAPPNLYDSSVLLLIILS